jgi:hypothetical protein
MTHGKARARRVRRALTFLAAGAAVAAITATEPASAAPVPGHRAISAGTTVSPADASGCNGDVCINVTGDFTGWSAWATSHGQYLYGHIQILGPGQNWSGADGWGPPNTPTVYGGGGGQICAIAWVKTTTGYANNGEACETIWSPPA